MSYIQSNIVITLNALTSGNFTVSGGDSGKIFMIPAAVGGARVITLPAVSPGLRLKFICGGAIGNTVTITRAGGSTISGNLINTAGGNCVSFPKAGAVDVQFTAVAISGDQCELISDGTNWYCTGIGRAVSFA